MNLGTMRQELFDRGFDALTAARANQIINDAVCELDEQAFWPYREKVATGAAPLSIADLGVIEQVINTSMQNQPLSPMRYQALVFEFGDTTIAGPPQFYYVNTASATPVVTVFPVSTNSLSVRYWRFSPTLSSDSDTPLAPIRFHQIYMKIAQRMGESERGNLNAAAGLQNEIDIATGRMGQALLYGQQAQGAADYFRDTGASLDG